MPGDGGGVGGAGLGLDFSAVIQAAVVGLVLFTAAVAAVRRAASRYFVVDAAGFAVAFDDHHGESAYPMSPQGKQQQRQPMARGRAPADGEELPCAECGGVSTKTCTGCKRMRYCSRECQYKHWQSGHKTNCKTIKLLDPVDKLSSGGVANSKKSSSLGRISLVPGHRKSNKVIFPYDEFLKLYNWKDRDFVICGLVNCGNSCFVNVVLQCLSCTRPLVAYLLGKDHSKECSTRHGDWCFLCELQCHIQRATDSVHPFAPMNILSHLPNIGGNLGYGRQEDAHEFMRFAIDKMQSACLDEFGGEKAVDLSTQETTIIQHIFGGRLNSEVICTSCGMVSNRYDNMMDLTVEIQGDAESLEECLNQFTAIEWLDGDNKYRCDGCSAYVKARKHLTVHQAPNILTITLKRFQSGRFGKLNKRVTFPMELDLAPYMSTRDGSDQYDLYAVIVHLDMLNASFFGHYICYIKDCQGRWCKVDDCKVMIVDEEEVHAQGAYMLLYNRRTARPRPLYAVKEPVQQHKQCISPSNGQSHLTPEDVSLKFESLSKPSEDLRAVSESSDRSLLKMYTMDQESGLHLPLNTEVDKFTTNRNLHLPVSSAFHVPKKPTRGPGYLLEDSTTMRSEQFGNSAYDLSSAHSSGEECKEPAPCIDSVDFMDIDSLAGIQVENQIVQQEHVLGDSIGVIDNETSVLTFDTGMSGIPKPPFTAGFLEEPSRINSSLAEQGHIGSNIATSSPKINGYCNEDVNRSEQGVIANNHGGLTSSGSVQCNGYMLATSYKSDYLNVNGDTQSSNDSLQAAKRGVPCANGLNPRPHREPLGSNSNQNSTSNGQPSVVNHNKSSWNLPLKECNGDKPFLPRGFLVRPSLRVESSKGNGGLPFSNGTLQRGFLVRPCSRVKSVKSDGGLSSNGTFSSDVNGNSISSNSSSSWNSKGGIGIPHGSSSLSEDQEPAAVLPDQIQGKWGSDCTTCTAFQPRAAVFDNTNGHHGENRHAVFGTTSATFGEESGRNGTVDTHGSSCRSDDISVTLVSENGLGSENAVLLKPRSAALEHDGLRRRASKYF